MDAARAFYDATAERYVDFVGTEISSATEGQVDRSLLEAFVELVKEGELGTVADVGCGPGRAAAFLAARGLEVVGVDVSPEMLASARNAHPAIRFEGGSLDSLPFGDQTLAGAVCWYSIIYTPPTDFDEAFAELARVLVAGGYLLIAFQAGGGEKAQQGRTLGAGRSLTCYRHDVDEVIRSLEGCGFRLHATAVREARLDHESTPQAFVFARRDGDEAR